MTMKNRILKLIAVSSLVASAYLSSFTVGVDAGLLEQNAFSVSEARLADVSIAEERRIATESIAETRNDPTVISIKDNPVLLRIQKEIVEGNKGILWFKDANHDYGLRPVKEIEYAMNGREYLAEAHTVGDGYIFISTGYLMQENANMNGSMVMRSNRPSSIYNNSAIAYTIGHEIAHWKNNQLYHRTEKQDIQFENQADLSSLDYMDGTFAHGYGGGLISYYRTLAGRKNLYLDSVHASVDERYRNIANYITQVSKGRIKIDMKGNCTYDGKPLVALNNSKMAPHSNVLEVVAEERTMYVAGQIAFAIKYGVWNKNHIYVATQDDILHNKSKKIVMLVDNPKAGGYKIIDKFDINEAQYEKIALSVMFNDTNYLNSLNDEGKYFAQIFKWGMGK